jgi:predicted RNA-binding Zn-ribbon protein involved in translation (DUF1610 family)
MQLFKIKFSWVGMMFKTKAEKEKIRLDKLREQRFETDTPVADEAVTKANEAIDRSRQYFMFHCPQCGGNSSSPYVCSNCMHVFQTRI